MKITLRKVAIALLIVAILLGFLTYSEGNLAFKSSPYPEEILLKDLIARGPDGNANVVVTNFCLCANYAYEADRNNNNFWKKLWVPVVPVEEVDQAAEAPPKPNRVKALFFSTQIHDAGSMNVALNQTKVQGLVTNRIESVHAQVRQLLQQNYPGTNFDACLIIQVGRTPFSRTVVYLFGAGSLLALLGAGGIFLYDRRHEQTIRRTPVAGPAERIEKRQVQPAAPTTVQYFQPDDTPGSSDYFVPAPKEIGKVLSAHTSLRRSHKPRPIWLRLLIGILVAAGCGLIVAFIGLFGWQAGFEAWMVVFVATSVLAAPFAITLAFYFTGFRHYCAYVGENGAACFTCSGSTKNVKWKDVFFLATRMSCL
jgi:hypothetical protein